MLVLTRRIGEKIIIMGEIEVMVIGVERDRVRLGIKAPQWISVVREELLERRSKGSLGQAEAGGAGILPAASESQEG